MASYRLMLFSNRSPRSVLNFARRIERELPNVRVCGIMIQRPKRRNDWYRAPLQRIFEIALSIVHAAKANPDWAMEMDVEEFRLSCNSMQWPFLLLDDLSGSDALSFVRTQNSDLALVIGTPMVDAEILATPRQGSVSVQITLSAFAAASLKVSGEEEHRVAEELDVTIQPPFGSLAASHLISLSLPAQPYDTREGWAVKVDLVSDDVLIRAAEYLSKGGAPQMRENIAKWLREILPACFDWAASRKPTTELDLSDWRRRPAWKLFLHTLLLLSPYVIARNWCRRWRGNFPVVILFHHLVSDRPHRMGIPTELFLREARFLQKYYRVVALSDANEILQSGFSKVPTVVLTFDDGYEDNFLNLRAVTEATGIPVTLFVCTKIVEKGEEFEHDRTSGTRGFRALSWRQIDSWQSEAVEFGSHTRSHFNCGSSDISALEDEIIGSSDDMRRHLGTAPRFFAFPWGKTKDMSSEAVQIANSTYARSFSTLSCVHCANSGTSHKVFGREGLPSSVWELELTLQSVFELASTLRRRSKQSRNGHSLILG